VPPQAQLQGGVGGEGGQVPSLHGGSQQVQSWGEDRLGVGVLMALLLLLLLLLLLGTASGLVQ
jgi:hypothetical protein